MLGAIAGDIIGSPYEFAGFKKYQFPLFSSQSVFTDDTVLTIAVADAFLNHRDVAQTLKEYARRYPNRGYGTSFGNWVRSKSSHPYYSWGNGSAMRTSPIGYLCSSIQEASKKAREYAAVTHNHPEGIKGAQAVSLAIFMARTGAGKKEIREETEHRFLYDLSKTLDEIRPSYEFTESCQETVPAAIIAFIESSDFEDAVRNAISLGGDADTLACITGSIAEAYYGNIPASIASEARARLPEEFLHIIDTFYTELKI